jgi:hypothetical protein
MVIRTDPGKLIGRGLSVLVPLVFLVYVSDRVITKSLP